MRITSIDALRGFVMFCMIFVNDLDHVVPAWMKHYHGKSGMTFVDMVFPAFLFIVGMSIPFALESRLNKVPLAPDSGLDKGGSVWETMFFIALRALWLFGVGVLLFKWVEGISVFNGWFFIWLAWIFIIPFLFARNLGYYRSEVTWRSLAHIVGRTLFLLGVGIMMVNNETPAPDGGNWSAKRWALMFFVSAIVARCSFSPRWLATSAWKRVFDFILELIRLYAIIILCSLAEDFQGADGKHIITLSPFSINTEWYGILGLIGAAYFVGAVVFLIFRTNRTALLGCVVLLMSLYAADKTGAFEGFALARYVSIGEMLGSHAAITVAGVLLASILTKSGLAGNGARVRFTVLFIAGFATAAWLTTGLYGIVKNDATPAWGLWACAFTAALWLGFYLLADAWPGSRASKLATPFCIAGQNVLLAYLLSELFPAVREWLDMDDWYSSLGHADVWHAVARSTGCAVFILSITAGLNRIGFRVRL